MFRFKWHIFSCFYRFVRAAAISLVFFYQKRKSKPHDLESIVEFGETYFCQAFRLDRFGFFKSKPVPELAVRFCGLTFPTPLTAAAYQGNTEMLAAFFRLGIGGGCFKTQMLSARPGNLRPRLLPCEEFRKKGLINALGLPGKGIDVFLNELDLACFLDRPIGFSIGAHSAQEYFVVAKKIIGFIEKKQLDQAYIELNISCPNTDDGQLFLEKPDEVFSLVQLIKHHKDIPLGIKLAPQLLDKQLLDYAKRCLMFNKIFLNCGNTQVKEDSRLSVGKGGLSGEPIFDRCLEMARILKPTGIPVMATGGISTIKHIRLLKQEGVTLFGMATALIEDPFCIPRLNQALLDIN